MILKNGINTSKTKIMNDTKKESKINFNAVISNDQKVGNGSTQKLEHEGAF